MRNTALPYRDEYNEVPVSSTDVLEANGIALREELREHKADFKDFKMEMRAALARLDHDIKSSAAELRSEIQASVAELRAEIQASVAQLRAEIQASVAELRAEIRATGARAENDLRDYIVRADTQFAEMRREHKELRDKVDKMAADIATIGNKFNALFWALGGIVGFAGLAKSLGWI